MKKLLLLPLLIISIGAFSQFSPTAARTRFVNGIALGTKLDASYNTADSGALYWRADSVIMGKYRGTARALAWQNDLAGYVPSSRTLTIFGTTQDLSANRTWSAGDLTNGYGIAALSYNGSGAASVVVDTATLSGKWLRLADTLAMLNGRLSAITLNTENVLFNTGNSFARTGGVWTGALSFKTQTANTFLAGPTTGAAANPTFRALVAADIPATLTAYIWNQNGSTLAAQTGKFWISDTIKTSGVGYFGSINSGVTTIRSDLSAVQFIINRFSSGSPQGYLRSGSDATNGLYLGTSTGDALVLQPTTNDAIFQANAIPATTGSGNVGTSSKRWASVNGVLGNFSSTSIGQRFGNNGTSNSIAGYDGSYNGGGADMFQFFDEVTLTTTNTTRYASFTSSPAKANLAFTLTDLYSFFATNSTNGAASTVTNHTGFYVASLFGTNNYGFRSTLAASANNWNLYFSGSAKSYHAGKFQLGSLTATAGDEQLQVTGTSSFGGNSYPTTTNTYTNGTSSLRWSNTYSVLGNFSSDLTAAKYFVSALNTAPSSASDTGTTGEIRYTSTYIYVCIATNTWVRSALTTW